MLNLEQIEELREHKKLVKKCLDKMNTYNDSEVKEAYLELRSKLSLAHIEKIMVATWNRITLAGEGQNKGKKQAVY